MSPRIAASNIGVINDLVSEVQSDGAVGRRNWSSATVKLQFTTKVVRGMHAQLSTAYEPIYDVTARGDRPPDLQDWSQHARIQTNPDHVHALEQAKLLYSDPANCTRRLYYAEDTDSSAFWEGKVHDSHEYLDSTSRTPNGIPVYTGDASGFAAGVWYRDSSHIRQFPEDQRALNLSSNFRELYTALLGLQHLDFELPVHDGPHGPLPPQTLALGATDRALRPPAGASLPCALRPLARPRVSPSWTLPRLH